MADMQYFKFPLLSKEGWPGHLILRPLRYTFPAGVVKFTVIPLTPLPVEPGERFTLI